jgi:hypothetical protein
VAPTVNPALRVVGRDDTAQQQQVRDSARAQMAAPTAQAAVPASALAGYVTDQYTLMRKHRDTIGRGWSDRLLRALRAFDGVYDPEIAAEIRKFGGSNVYARTIAMKCRGTSSLLRDVYLGTDRPWGVEPSPDPEVPPEIMQAIGSFLQGKIKQQVDAHFQAIQLQQAHQHATMAAHAYGASVGMAPEQVDAAIPSSFSGPSQGAAAGGALPQPGTPAVPPPPPPPPLPDASQLRDQYQQLVEDARDQAKRKAAEQAKVVEDKLEEILSKGGFYTALAEFLVDLPLFPYAVIKGPTVRIKTEVQWSQPSVSSGGPAQQGGPQNNIQGAMQAGQQGAPPPPKPKPQTRTPKVIDQPVLCWQRISPFDIYWTPGVNTIEDANVIERSRLTRAEINDLLDLPGFITEEVRAVLDEYGRGGIVDNWDTTDAERAVLESREDPRFNQSGLLACLEFQGNAQGQFLLDMGIDATLVPDPLRDYYCNAWLIGRHIIKVQLSPSPRKRHQYYVTSFEKVPGTPVGNGLPDLLADIQTVMNATLRSMVNNLSIASGPQVTVNDDRLADGEDGEEMYPWKRWHVKSDPFGNNTEPAISFFQPNSTASDLLQVYGSFSTLADEISAIPKFATGTPPMGGLGRTASGLSLLMQNSAKILQTVAANIDRDVVSGILDGLFDMVMLTDETGLLTGEEKIRVLGVKVAMQKETQRARQLEFLQITNNPIDLQITGLKGRAEVLRTVVEEIGIPGQDIVPSADQMEQKEKAQELQQQQQAMMQQQAQGQGSIAGSPKGSPSGGPAQQGGPQPQPGSPGNAPPTPGAPQGPRTNLMNTPNAGANTGG